MLYEKLDYVLAVAEERNLTKAAQRLYISQPTLTLYLNRLEEELGAKLFDRTKSPIAITQAGQYYVQKMKQVAMAERTIRSDLKFMSNPTQTLVVGIGQVRGNHWMPILLPEFCARHPQTNIQILQKSEEAIYEGLEQQRVDLVIGAYPTASPVFAIEELMFEKVFLAAHKRFGVIPREKRGLYDIAHPYPAQPEQLRGLPFITPGPGNGLYASYEALIRENGLHPARTIAIGNLSTGAKLMAQGLGVQMLSGPVVEQTPGLKLEDIDFFVLPGMQALRRCVAVYHPDSIKGALIQDFLEIVRSSVLMDCSNCVIPK